MAEHAIYIVYNSYGELIVIVTRRCIVKYVGVEKINKCKDKFHKIATGY